MVGWREVPLHLSLQENLISSQVSGSGFLWNLFLRGCSVSCAAAEDVIDVGWRSRAWEVGGCLYNTYELYDLYNFYVQ